jgi:glutathione peroxidase-family protein
MKMNKFRNEVLLIVNVAISAGSLQCGETAACTTSTKNGFEVLAAPCNRWTGQKSDTEIKVCAEQRNNFPMTYKARQSGPNGTSPPTSY